MASIKEITNTHAHFKIILRQPLVSVLFFLGGGVLVVFVCLFWYLAWVRRVEYGLSYKSTDNKSYPEALIFLRKMGGGQGQIAPFQ